MLIRNILCFIILLGSIETVFAASGLFSFEVVIQKPDNSFLQDPNVDFKFTVTDDSGTCVIYSEEHLSIDMSGTNGQKTFQLGNTLLQTYPNPLVTTLTIDQVFSSSGVVYNCHGGGTYTSITSASRKVIMEFNDMAVDYKRCQRWRSILCRTQWKHKKLSTTASLHRIF